MSSPTKPKRWKLLHQRGIKSEDIEDPNYRQHSYEKPHESDELDKLREQQIKTEIMATRLNEEKIRLLRLKHDQEEERAKELHEGALKKLELQCQLLQAQIHAARSKSTSSSASTLSVSKPTFINSNLDASDEES